MSSHARGRRTGSTSGQQRHWTPRAAEAVRSPASYEPDSQISSPDSGLHPTMPGSLSSWCSKRSIPYSPHSTHRNGEHRVNGQVSGYPKLAWHPLPYPGHLRWAADEYNPINVLCRVPIRFDNRTTQIDGLAQQWLDHFLELFP